MQPVPELCLKCNVQFHSDKYVLQMRIIVAFKLQPDKLIVHG